MHWQTITTVLMGGMLLSCTARGAGSRKKIAGASPTPGMALPAEGPAAPGASESKALATIESVHAELEPGNPSRARVMISGLLHDGATRVQSVEQHRTVQGVEITITTARPGHSSAGVALIPFERTVSVDLSGMGSGAWRISANGTSTMLMVP